MWLLCKFDTHVPDTFLLLQFLLTAASGAGSETIRGLRLYHLGFWKSRCVVWPSGCQPPAKRALSRAVPRWWAEGGLYFPDTLNDVLSKLERKGDFIDSIFYCPYDIHELVTEEYLSKILWELNAEHKELLFLCAVRLFSSTRIAKIRNQSDRNIRKVRGTMLKKIRKKLLPALWDKAEKQQPMTLLEKDFLEESGMEIDSGEKK